MIANKLTKSLNDLVSAIIELLQMIECSGSSVSTKLLFHNTAIFTGITDWDEGQCFIPHQIKVISCHNREILSLVLIRPV